jgi:transposase InsO family protein
VGKGLLVGGVKSCVRWRIWDWIDEDECVVQLMRAGQAPTLFTGLRERIDRRLVDRREQALTLPALQMALDQRQPEPGLIHHTDRGTTGRGGGSALPACSAHGLKIRCPGDRMTSLVGWTTRSAHQVAHVCRKDTVVRTGSLGSFDKPGAGAIAVAGPAPGRWSRAQMNA